MNNLDKNIWHPFTQEALYGDNIKIVKGKDTILYDDNGNEYIDAISSWWVNIHGHSNRYIANKIAQQARQLEHVIFAGFTHPQAITLAERLLHLFKNQYQKVFFTDNGSTSIEVALKMAIQFFSNKNAARKSIIAFENAYHGDTFGAMSVGARSTFSAPFDDYLFDVIRIPIPNDNNFESTKLYFQELIATKNIAAFIFEPLLLGSGGMLMYEAKYLDQFLAIAKNEEVICIADEVLTGFGRTGKMFACDYLSNKPDIICLSKGITGGFLPLGVTLCTQIIYNSFYSNDKKKALYHGHSYTANPIACAAANANLDLFKQSKTFKNIDRIVAQHKKFAKELVKIKYCQNIRQCGTILAFDVVTHENTHYFNNIRDKLYQLFIDKKIIIRPLGNTIYILPPYCISNKQLSLVYQAIIDIILIL